MSIEKDKNIDSAKPMTRILAAIFGCAILITVVVLYSYFSEFGQTLPVNREGWAQMGEAFGGILGPIFSFLTLVALVFTVALQSRQVELASQQSVDSQKNLDRTHAAMERTAAAQSRTSEAIYEQSKFAATSARLSALSALLDVTNEELGKYQAGTAANMTINDMASLRARKNKIANEILSITGELNIRL